MANTTTFLKSSVSEQVLRKSLYWLSEHCDWTLDENDSQWVVGLNGEDFSSYKSQLDKLINDNLLREELDLETKVVRKDIIQSVLHRVLNVCE